MPTPDSAPPSVRPRISVVVPTKDAGPGFAYLCRHLAQVRDRFGLEILVIDSGSRDGTADIAERAGIRVHRIAAEEFGHGQTRNLGVRLTAGGVVCFLTQDVLPCTPDWPLRFAAALDDPAVAGVYGRQVPRDATTMEMFFVALNYPAQRLRSAPRAADWAPKPGHVLFSNAFSAIRRDVWAAIPFREDLLVSEDQLWAEAALRAGYSLIYEADVEALHAHAYTLPSLFRRTYLLAASLAAGRLDRAIGWTESVRYLLREVRYFVRQGHTFRLPQLAVYELVRWLGYQAGRRRRRLPAMLDGWLGGPLVRLLNGAPAGCAATSLDQVRHVR